MEIIDYEPVIEVGIVKQQTVSIDLFGHYIISGKGISPRTISGAIDLHTDNTRITLTQSGALVASADEIKLVPQIHTARAKVRDVVIGINFHWQQKEDQLFNGFLRFYADQSEVQVVNGVLLESYLLSVVSSEMKSSAPEEYIKAHAIISRSWLLRQIQGREKPDSQFVESSNEILKWFDRETHIRFHVCADDHCQRYQGESRIENRSAVEAVKATRGQALVFEGVVCDTRFSKCCGGISEAFENCWGPETHPYLKPVADMIPKKGFSVKKSMNENQAKEWISAQPEVFCNTNDKYILSTVLNDYDLKTNDFFRWQETLTQQKISALIYERTKRDIGAVTALVPLKRGPSGRIFSLKVVGLKGRFTIGKELMIRRLLSDTHLYSSAFMVEPQYEDGSKIPTSFVLKGAGWGHGVGLCQIGAAVMAFNGYNCKRILAHYFNKAELKQLY